MEYSVIKMYRCNIGWQGRAVRGDRTEKRKAAEEFKKKSSVERGPLAPLLAGTRCQRETVINGTAACSTAVDRTYRMVQIIWKVEQGEYKKNKKTIWLPYLLAFIHSLRPVAVRVDRHLMIDLRHFVR